MEEQNTDLWWNRTNTGTSKRSVKGGSNREVTPFINIKLLIKSKRIHNKEDHIEIWLVWYKSKHFLHETHKMENKHKKLLLLGHKKDENT